MSHSLAVYPGTFDPFTRGHEDLVRRAARLYPAFVLAILVHLLFGVWGIAAYRSFPAARTYGRSVAIVYGILTIMGLIPGLNTIFGLIPLHGNDVWLHALLAIIAAYFGWVQKPGPDTVTATTATPR